MTRIFFWSADSSGCAYYRCEMPAAALAERGYDTLVASVMPDEWLDSAVIVGQRVSQPGPTSRWQQLAREGQVKLVYEIDDDLLDVDPSNGPAWNFFSRPDIRSNIKRNIQVADVVTVTNNALAERVERLNPTVRVVPNHVPAWLLGLSTPPPGQPLTIGWAGGASHQMDWAEAVSEVARFVTRDRGTEMHLIGWRSPDLWKRLPADRRRFTEWLDLVPALYKAIDFDIGLAPLRPHVFNQAKSYIKALELAALGIPCIASDVGPYSEFVRHGETGFLVCRPHEWSKCLKELLDPVVRAEMGAKARSLASEHTIENNIRLWEAALIG
jgi:glycosyltransferase involved in cell wall biosynthesis